MRKSDWLHTVSAGSWYIFESIFAWLIGQWVMWLNNKTARYLFLSISMADGGPKLTVWLLLR